MATSYTNEWIRVEKKLKDQWLSNNTNPALTWEDVKDSVKLGWLESKGDVRGPLHSIH